MRIDNNLTTNKTAFKANFIASSVNPELHGLFGEIKKICTKIPHTDGDTILLTECTPSDLVWGLFEYFKKGKPTPVLSGDAYIGTKNGTGTKIAPRIATRLNKALIRLADRIKRLPEQYRA